MDKSCIQLIRDYIDDLPDEAVFAKVDIDGVGSDNAIRMALCRLVQEGICERLMPSVYCKAGDRSCLPDPYEIGSVIARNYGWKVVPGPEIARYRLGLADDEPEGTAFVSTGPSRKYEIPGYGYVAFRHSRARFMQEMSPDSAMVVNALVGLKGIDISDDVLNIVSGRLSKEQKEMLLKEKHLAPKWMEKYLDVIGNG